MMLLDGHVGPVERAATEQHVTYERVDGRLADQSYEEQLLDDVRGHGAQRRQSQQQLAEPCRLSWILRPDVVLESTL